MTETKMTEITGERAETGAFTKASQISTATFGAELNYIVLEKALISIATGRFSAQDFGHIIASDAEINAAFFDATDVLRALLNYARVPGGRRARIAQYNRYVDAAEELKLVVQKS